MFNVQQVLTAFEDLVGYRQNPDPTGEQLLDLTTSISGIWVQGRHSLLEMDNILSAAPDFAQYTFPAYNAGTAYSLGAIVSYNSKLYKAIQAGTGQDPETPASTYWELYSPFTEWMRERLHDGITQSVRDWITKKTKLKSAKNLLADGRLFNFDNTGTILETSTGKVVGLAITVKGGQSVKSKAKRLGLQITANQTLPVKIFRSTVVQPVHTQNLVYDQGGGVQWFDIDYEFQGGGHYFIGYDQDSLVGQAVNNAINYRGFLNQTDVFPFGDDYLVISNFRIDSDFLTIWDLNSTQYGVDTNFGLNLDFDVRCDYTQFVIDQKNMFADVVATKTAMDILRKILNNPNSNTNRHTNNISREELLYEIDGNGKTKSGIGKQYDDELAAIQLSVENIDPVCLPCKRSPVTIRGHLYG